MTQTLLINIKHINLNCISIAPVLHKNVSSNANNNDSDLNADTSSTSNAEYPGTKNIHHEAAESWQDVQIKTTDCFKTCIDNAPSEEKFGQIVNLRNESDHLRDIAENDVKDIGEKELITDENTVINTQSSLAQRAVEIVTENTENVNVKHSVGDAYSKLQEACREHQQKSQGWLEYLNNEDKEQKEQDEQGQNRERGEINKSAIDFILNKPQDYNPYDDVGDD
jgi:hypothetical protein